MEPEHEVRSQSCFSTLQGNPGQSPGRRSFDAGAWRGGVYPIPQPPAGGLPPPGGFTDTRVDFQFKTYLDLLHYANASMEFTRINNNKHQNRKSRTSTIIMSIIGDPFNPSFLKLLTINNIMEIKDALAAAAQTILELTLPPIHTITTLNTVIVTADI
jgi:hypothetical protein